jgi:hypothetical protein
VAVLVAVTRLLHQQLLLPVQVENLERTPLVAVALLVLTEAQRLLEA